MSHLKAHDFTHFIMSARRGYNEAISCRDVDSICSFLSADYHVLTGQGVQAHGVEEQRKRWTHAFQHDPNMLYRRTTRELRLNERLGFAEELGNWVGKYTLDNRVFLVAGVYSAKWCKPVNDTWLVQAEVFTTLKSKSFDLQVGKPRG
jgi:ketosteroid isomerase-like protein